MMMKNKSRRMKDGVRINKFGGDREMEEESTVVGLEKFARGRKQERERDRKLGWK